MRTRLSHALSCGVVLLALGGPLAHAQTVEPAQGAAPMAPGPAPHEVAARSNTLVAATVGGTMAYGYAQWWRDGMSGRFKTVREGWFGQNTKLSPYQRP